MVVIIIIVKNLLIVKGLELIKNSSGKDLNGQLIHALGSKI